jgi:hypothetical protein
MTTEVVCSRCDGIRWVPNKTTATRMANAPANVWAMVLRV